MVPGAGKSQRATARHSHGPLLITHPPTHRPRSYEVRVPKEEADLVGDLRYSWRKLKKLSADVGDNLATLQVREGRSR